MPQYTAILIFNLQSHTGDNIVKLNKKRVQLWTDSTYTEFAIIFDSRMVVKTEQDANYDQLIDESTYTDEYDYDWAYTLSQWVPFYFSNKYISHVMGKKEKTEEFNMQFDPEMDSARSRLHNLMNRKPRSQPKPKPKPTLKCHFCNLRYCVEDERKEHESFWHSNRFGLQTNLLIV